MKRINFFNWSLMLVVLVSGLVVTGCSEDEEDKFNYPLETLYGTWIGTGIYMESDGTWIDPTSSWMYEDLEFSITFYENGKYYGKGFFGTGSGTYKTKGNTITTYVDGEMYLYYKVTSLTNNKAELTMYDGSGDSMKLRVTKKSSASSELPSDEPKEEVEFKLDYTFAESGDMTRATGEEVYTTFYDKYIKTKVLTPRNYTLTFSDKVTGSSVATFKGSWETKDGVRLPEGEYIVTGTSSPILNDVKHASDSVFISFRDTVRITKDMTTLVLKANYNAYLLMFDAKDVRDIFYSYGNGGKIPLVKTNEDIYYLFIESLVYTNYANYINLYRNSGAVNRIMLESIPFSKGKYYYFNDMTNSFDIPMMESGN